MSMRIKPPYTAREILELFHPSHALAGHDPSRKVLFFRPELRIDLECSCGEFLKINKEMIRAAGLAVSHVEKGLRNVSETFV